MTTVQNVYGVLGKGVSMFRERWMIFYLVWFFSFYVGCVCNKGVPGVWSKGSLSSSLRL